MSGWDGITLHSGYAVRIGGKEIEIDSQVQASQVPDIIGTVHEPDVDEDMDSSQPVAGPSFLKQAIKRDPPSPAPTTAPKFVAPTNFYGAPPPKPKAKGPLFVQVYSERASRI